MKIQFLDYTFQGKTMKIIALADEIVREYQAEGYILTLRQLYYQFVARGLCPNTQREYNKLGSIISKARMAGLIDWSALDDRTRKVQSNSHWSNPGDILNAAAKSYAINTRSNQDHYPEVWVEKDALVGVLERSCVPLDVHYFSCRGYVSQSAMFKAAVRLKQNEHSGKKSIIIHLGDHDPSGLDMTRDIQDRLEIFGCEVKVERIALSMEQIQQYNPPPNPAKITDSRYKSYVAKHGDKSWELDALDPKIITQLIDDTVARYTDDEKRNGRISLQEHHRKIIQHVADNWRDKK